MPSPSRILFVHNSLQTFVASDLELLREKYQVEEYFVRSDLINPLAVWQKVRRNDLVFGWFASAHTLLPVLFARLLRKPSIIIIGGYDVANLSKIGYGHQRGGLRKFTSRLVFRFATRLLAFSQFSYREALHNAGVDGSKLAVVYCGVKPPALPAPVLKRETVLTVGKITFTSFERKGLGLFVEAARHLPDIPFVLAGEAEPEALKALKKIAPPNVTFTGRLSDSQLKEAFARAAVYVQASRHEGFGLAAAEAILRGCLPVLSRAGALPEVGGPQAFYLDNFTPVEVAAIISKALAEKDESRRKGLRQRIRDNFSVEARREKLYAEIERLLAKT